MRDTGCLHSVRSDQSPNRTETKPSCCTAGQLCTTRSVLAVLTYTAATTRSVARLPLFCLQVQQHQRPSSAKPSHQFLTQPFEQMSDEDADLLRAKRRRCAPKRYDDEDHQAATKDLRVKSSPADCNRPHQSLLDRTASLQQHTCPGASNSHHTNAAPDDAQTLHIVQQLAARLHAHNRPELGSLFGMPESSFSRLPSTR